MVIIWHGQSCFEIIAGSQKNGQVKIIIDPFSEELGLRLPKLEGDVALVSHDHQDHNNIKALEGSPFLIQGPGEYEVKGVYVRGIPSFHDAQGGKERGANTIYTIETEDLKICHLGDFGENELSDEALEQIGEVDILMIPVGGVYTISAKEAMKVMSQIEPRVTIPMHYAIPKLKVKLEGLDKFLKALGMKAQEPLDKLSIKKKDILPEEAKVVVLNP
ncbi:MAG: MBL fold metallo-hydrolase [Candidatus Wildermuthbacteria bacterium]|nr:MBL fold metallo-hydrolase [Candidatus Wildermuthbacteria bacterium]